MAVYRYAPGSIELLCSRMRRHHLAAVVIFAAAVCTFGFVRLPLRAALTGNTLFCLLMGFAWIAGRKKARQRAENLFRSAELEIDDVKISWDSKLSKRVLLRSEIVEACFAESGIWLRAKSRRSGFQVPPEIEDFDELSALLEKWLPEYTVRRNSPPRSIWAHARAYAVWIVAALLFYLAMSSQTRAIATPAYILAGAGIARSFVRSGRIIDERKWKILLPATGYLAAAALFGRALSLWLTH